MNRHRVSTTVDSGLLNQARHLQAWGTDAAMMDAALEALVNRFQDAEVDSAYEAYERHPLEEPDEWGDLASFLEANHRHRHEPRASDEGLGSKRAEP